MIFRTPRDSLFRLMVRDISAELESFLDDEALVGMDMHPPASGPEVEIVTTHENEQACRKWAESWDLDILVIKPGTNSNSHTFNPIERIK